MAEVAGSNPAPPIQKKAAFCGKNLESIERLRTRHSLFYTSKTSTLLS
jgi:hypothetical protein